ncbi:MAG: VOC family protein, partial [Pseudomonadota bacterium]|nr:VOC family protein [Pseudomonadota bacterium]
MSDDLKIDYVEFASPDMAASKRFFADAFGWNFVDYGPTYQAFADAGLDGGIDGSAGEPGDAPGHAPLVILKAADLEAAERQVVAAGGKIVRAAYAFPGGRRFHFREPGGNELAVW